MPVAQAVAETAGVPGRSKLAGNPRGRGRTVCRPPCSAGTWLAVAPAFPALFTEKRQADDILRKSTLRPGRQDLVGFWEPGQSRVKDRSRFDRDNADRWSSWPSSPSNIQAFVECIAMLGGRRSTGFRAPAGEQRRLLFDEALYDIGAFGFVIEEVRDRQYTGPSSLLGWAEP
jgi:hypothetical protein